MRKASSWSGSPSVRGSNEATRMILLTFSLIGLQFTWGIEMTYCTPYLLSLGLSKSRTALVWVAGPLSGLIMQPVVGIIADRSTSRYGRRRPFMLAGSVVVALCLFILGWTAEFVGLFMSEGEAKKSVTVFVAVLAIYAVDFAINAVQAGCRSLIVDTLPTSQQQAGSAWAARMGAAGHIVGYCIGSLDLVAILPSWLGGGTQFKKMATIAALGLCVAVGITSWAVKERRLLQTGSDDAGDSIFAVLTMLWKRAANLPPRIRGICWSQFWGWIGWFPFLFYSSTWVGETYYRYEHSATAAAAPEDDHDALGNIGRLGSISLVIFSIVTFTSSVLIPYLVRSPEPDGTTEKFTPRPPPSFTKSAQALLIKASHMQPDLVTTWMISNLLFAVIMFWAPAVHSLHAATTIVALCGIPWAVSCWAPFAEIGREINKTSTGGATTIRSSNIPGYTAVRASIDESGDEDLELEESQQSRRLVSEGVLRLNHADAEDELPSTGELSGVYLGVLNVYTTLPQFVGTFVSWIVFSILEPSRNEAINDTDPDHHKWLRLKEDAPNAISVCLFIGAMCAVVAAEATRRLRKIR